MSLTLDQLQSELREYFSRVEEVLSGLDVVVTQLQDRVSALEAHAGSGHSDERVEQLEGQLAAIVAALSDDSASDIIVRR